MKFVLNSYVKAFSLAPDQIRMRHLPQTRRFAISIQNEVLFHFTWYQNEASYQNENFIGIENRNEHNDSEITCTWTKCRFGIMQTNTEKYVEMEWTRSRIIRVRTDFWIQNSRLFPKQHIFFPDSRLSNRRSIETLQKRRNKAFTTMRCKSTGEIE